MKLIKTNPGLANRAYTAFHRAIGKRLMTICWKQCSKFPHTNNRYEVEDLYQDVLISFASKIDTFNTDRYPDEDSLRRGILNWLTEKARWTFNNKLRKTVFKIEEVVIVEEDGVFRNSYVSKNVVRDCNQSELGNDKKDSDNWFKLVSGDKDDREFLYFRTPTIEGARYKIFKFSPTVLIRLMERLPKVQREIVLTYIGFNNFPPKEAVADLMKRNKIKSESTLRVYKKRALDTMRAKLLDKLKMKE
jgi:DNA-directed RNA polymerase specialized sigma24 family protein